MTGSLEAFLQDFDKSLDVDTKASIDREVNEAIEEAFWIGDPDDDYVEDVDGEFFDDDFDDDIDEEGVTV